MAVTCNLPLQFSDEHPKETEELWSTLCSCWPNNLKVIIRYLLIISGMAPQELLPYVSTLYIYIECNISLIGNYLPNYCTRVS